MSFDIEIAARTVWMEARSEGEQGMKAVAFVIVNRHDAGTWFSGQTLTECCLIPYQFSCWNTSDPNRIAMARLDDDDSILSNCRNYILDSVAKNVDDPTMGATHYLNPSSIQSLPSWVYAATKTVQIGRHVFYKNVK